MTELDKKKGAHVQAPAWARVKGASERGRSQSSWREERELSISRVLPQGQVSARGQRFDQQFIRGTRSRARPLGPQPRHDAAW